jgi:addiction module RelE/StbE family toxin
MTVRYTREALRDLEQISSYLATRNRTAAAALLGAIETTVSRLARFPQSAQQTEMMGVRAAPVPGFPYIIFYAEDGRSVTIHYVRHAARLRPWEEP